MLLMAPIPMLFPLINMILVPDLLITTLQVMVCIYWRKKQNDEAKQKSQNAAADDLNLEQMRALKKIAKKETPSTQT